MNYCSECSAPVTLRVPAGDTLPRYVCDSCSKVHYRNPLIVTGCIVEAVDGRLLLCRRAIEPRAGYWTMPAGFMENDETLVQAAARETREEACAEVDILGLSSVISVPGANQVHIMFRSKLVGSFAAGDETVEAALYDERDIPWDELAFRTVRAALECFVADRTSGHFTVHQLTIPSRV
jgi:ADP-ribose pyrophosphatase YjhB (NUDIX family)